MWFQSQWAQKQQQTCRPPRRAAAGASEAEKKKKPTSCKESRRRFGCPINYTTLKEDLSLELSIAISSCAG